MTSLKDYVENMKEDQQAIYYFSSESVKSARNAPFMEKLVERGYEVFTYPGCVFMLLLLYHCHSRCFSIYCMKMFDLNFAL